MAIPDCGGLTAQAMDSLINFETVKLYGNEEHELKRYDRCLAGTTFKHFILNPH